EGRVVFRYVDGNPNGSRRDIAGITNARGNVVGLMPHPEHATEPGFGPSTDGLRFFTSAITATLATACARRRPRTPWSPSSRCGPTGRARATPDQGAGGR